MRTLRQEVPLYVTAGKSYIASVPLRLCRSRGVAAAYEFVSAAKQAEAEGAAYDIVSAANQSEAETAGVDIMLTISVPEGA